MVFIIINIIQNVMNNVVQFIGAICGIKNYYF